MNYFLYFQVQQFVRKLLGKFVKPAVIVKAGTNNTNIDFKAPENQVSGNLVEVWYSLEQYIGLKEDKLSSTTVDFIRSEGNLETKRLYWFSKPKMC